MKKLLSILLCLMLLGSAAMAETKLNGGENRHITFDKAEPNEPIDGLSPVTGRILQKVLEDEYRDGFSGQAVSGRYMPIMVQIDNSDGGIGYETGTGKFTGNRAPWGAQYADVIYETPLYRQGNTRMTFLFSDMIPSVVGPCRSARLFHAWLREEWDCAFFFHGQQEYTATNVPAVFKETGADKKGILFSGTAGKTNPWKLYSDSIHVLVKGAQQMAKPHHVAVNAAALVANVVPADFVPANHTWLFTDELPEDGDDAEIIYVNWGKGDLTMYNSELQWDEDEECYIRYMVDPYASNKTNGYHEYKNYDYLSGGYNGPDAQVITFNNIIVQFTDMEWARTDAPNPTVLGTGNADYFMGGKHIAGVWNRDTLADRTVFYNEDGEEIELQRGRTLIIVMDYQYESEGRSVSYE